VRTVHDGDVTAADRRRRRGELLRLLAVGLTIAAVVKELRLPKDQRTWHGRVWVVPYDFRLPTPTRVRLAWWAPDDDRIVGPRAFGVGWAINLPGLAAALRSIGRNRRA
jgi:hypothetical protein